MKTVSEKKVIRQFRATLLVEDGVGVRCGRSHSKLKNKVGGSTSSWTGAGGWTIASFLEQFKQKHINCCKIGCSVGTSKPLINLFSGLFHLITNSAWKKKNLSHCVVLGFTVGWKILMIWLRKTSSLLREFRCCYHQF